MAETYSAGVVTAYGAAVRGGYTGTYEEFCAEQAEFAENAAAVAQAKEDVETMQGQVEQAASTFVNTTVPAAVTTVQEAGAAQVQAVQSEGTMQAQAVETVGAQQTAAVGTAGSEAVDAVEAAETAATDAVTAAQTAAVQAVQTESTTQQAAIQTKGQETIASIPEDYTALSGEVDDLKSSLEDTTSVVNIFDNDNITSGYRISAQGENYQDASYFISKYINVSEGITYKKNSPAADAYHRFATYDASKTFVRKIDDSNTVTIESGEAFIRFCGNLSELSTTTFVNASKPLTGIDYDSRDVISKSLLAEKPNTSYVDGSFINASTNEINQASGFGLLNPIPLKKYQTIYLTTKGYATNTGMIAVCDENNTKRTTVSTSIDSTKRTYSYTASDNCFVTGTIRSNEQYDVEIYLSVPEILKSESIKYPQIFDKVVCVGDSLTYGHDGQERLAKNYPYFFSKLAQCDTSNQGLTGRTSKQWWDELGQSFDFTPFDCAIIYLGTNGGLTDTVSTDCKADYTQNADTNTGCYGKIIGKIKADAPNCKIFCVAGPSEYVRRLYNSVVRQIAVFYDVALIDMENCILSDDGSTSSAQRTLYRPYDGIHYDALGYFTFANVLYNTMSDVIASDLGEYKNA